MSLLELLYQAQTEVDALRRHGVVELTGNSMNIAAVVAIARHECLPVVNDEKVLSRLSESVKTVEDGALRQNVIYGLNTGFGGSASARVDDPHVMGRSLMQTLQCGVLIEADKTEPRMLGGELLPHSIPAPWVKATIATRINQCVRGHSALTKEIVEAALKLVHHHIVPIVPLRGSISASGDLMPLTYIAGALEASPDIYVNVGTGSESRVMTAKEALHQAGLKPQVFGSRAALGFVNGTALSAATASLAMYDSMNLAAAATTLTCLVSEGLAARAGWLHPFIVEEISPHPGQGEVGAMMRKFLEGSSLVSDRPKTSNKAGFEETRSLPIRPSVGLTQDRYPLRTAPQWLGPQFEDLILAHSQISIELNSTSDNPVIDSRDGGGMYHSGNFQAAAVTSALEKIRGSASMMGKMLYSQFTEMLNVDMSAGLPPNLAADDPTSSMCLKALDVSMASYQSELSFLANTMSNHVQSAEMHNQAINSLAFLATRYTSTSLEVLSIMIAAGLYAACQAIDLRVMHSTFLEKHSSVIAAKGALVLTNGHKADALIARTAQAHSAMRDAWWNKAALSIAERCEATATAILQELCYTDSQDKDCSSITVDQILLARKQLQLELLEAYEAHSTEFLADPTSAQYLGRGTAEIYKFVRTEVGVPVLRGLVDQPAAGDPDDTGKRTIGSWVSMIYEAVRDGRLEVKITAVCSELQVGKGGS